jgi:hypothetical protein
VKFPTSSVPGGSQTEIMPHSICHPAQRDSIDHPAGDFSGSLTRTLLPQTCRGCSPRVSGMGTRKIQPPGQSAFWLRIQLQEIDPVVWRRLLVPGAVRMGKLSDMILAVMGWTNSHLHAFRIGDERYGMNFDDYPEGEIDEDDVTVLQALRDQPECIYDYDFGDGWKHQVAIEDLTWSAPGLKFAVCLDGQNACPPEDVGGPYGYAAFLEAISDPAHEEHESYIEWVGGSFDPTKFELASVNAVLQKLR